MSQKNLLNATIWLISSRIFVFSNQFNTFQWQISTLEKYIIKIYNGDDKVEDLWVTALKVYFNSLLRLHVEREHYLVLQIVQYEWHLYGNRHRIEARCDSTLMRAVWLKVSLNMCDTMSSLLLFLLLMKVHTWKWRLIIKKKSKINVAQTMNINRWWARKAVELIINEGRECTCGH